MNQFIYRERPSIIKFSFNFPSNNINNNLNSAINRKLENLTLILIWIFSVSVVYPFPHISSVYRPVKATATTAALSYSRASLSEGPLLSHRSESLGAGVVSLLADFRGCLDEEVSWFTSRNTQKKLNRRSSTYFGQYLKNRYLQ